MEENEDRVLRVPVNHASIMQLIHQYLKQHDYVETSRQLEVESGESYDADRMRNANVLVRALTKLEEMEMLMAMGPFGDNADANRRALEEELASYASGPDTEPAESFSRQTFPSNVVCVRWSRAEENVLALSCTDKSLRILDASTGAVLAQDSALAQSSILDIAWHPSEPRKLALGSMDSVVRIVQWLEDGRLKVLHELKTHKKYANRTVFVGDRWLVTGSYDGTMCVYEAVAEEYELRARMEYAGTVEAILPVEDGAVLVAARNDNYLHEVDLATCSERRRINMNAFGDDHVSFTAMDLARGPDQAKDFVLVATDKDRVLLMHLPSALLVQTYYGVSSDGFSQPRLVWDALHPGRFFVSSQDKSICVFRVRSGQLIHRIRSHSNIVRCMDRSASGRSLCAGSFDKSATFYTLD